MKTCRLCSSSENGFYGTRLVCKKCICLRSLKWRVENLERSRSYHSEYNKQVYNPKNRDKIMAMNRVRDAIKFKGMERENCFCGQTGEAHHYLGYAPEHWYDIKWLCKKHHEEAHHAITHR